jgi:polygalacturonase
VIGRLLGAAIAALVIAPGGPARAADAARGPEADPWARLPGILARIRPPVFPDREFPITDFGAKRGQDATGALRAAIEACRRAGGGRVVVPPGEFPTGPIHLESNVNLHVSEGATLLFSRDPADYLPPVRTRWEGVELMGYSPLVYAYGKTNVALTGRGTLDGQADGAHWWPWKRGEGGPDQKPDRDRLFARAEAGVPVAERVCGGGCALRPQFVQLYRCTNVLVEGVRITRSPMWAIHPVLCRNVTVRGVTVASLGPNNDGCDPESSTDVLVEDCLFDTGDDCIAIKSGRNADGRRLAAPSERIVVRGCRMRAGHGGVTIGSEATGGVRDVFVERCAMSSPDLERGLRIKTNARRGGRIEGVYVRDVEIGEVGSAIDVDLRYEEAADGPFAPVVRDLRIDRLTVGRARRALFVRGLPGSPVEGLRLRDSVFRALAGPSRLENVGEVVLRGVVMAPAEPAPEKEKR